MWSSLIIFIIVLFLYIHIQQQYKSGENLEIYEYEYTSSKKLQEVVILKQPVIFPLELPSVQDNAPLETLHVKDSRDYQTAKTHVDPIVLSQSSARGLLDTDTKSVFYSNRNAKSIASSSTWTEWFSILNSYLKPSFCLNTEYDILYGSRKTMTTTVYHHENNVYLYVPPYSNKSHIRMKMSPWKSEPFLSTVMDYANYEFWCKENLFQSTERVKCLDFIVKPGYVLYIPPYWFYSIEFQDKENEVCMVKYTTGANFLANIKHIGLYNLQQQNIQEKWWKPFVNNDQEDGSSTETIIREKMPKEERIRDISGNEDLAQEFLQPLQGEPMVQREPMVPPYPLL
jgi:hypothetical protein